MKNLITYLKALWRRGLDSQRKEVGVISGEATIEHPYSTYSAPFGTCWQPSGKLHSVVRCAAMLVMLFTIGSGNVWADTYALVTDASTLAEGDEIIIVNDNATPTKALGTTQNGNNRAAVNITVTNGKITPGADVQIITLGTATISSTTYWTLKVGKNAQSQDQYLYSASNSNNYLRTTTDLQNTGKWSISISSGTATIDAQANRPRMRFNSTLFSCYAANSGTGTLVRIYKKEAAAFTVTASSNNNSWGTVSVSGTTITATPADCYQVVSGTGGYTVVSGTYSSITHTGNSNTISVTPTANCSIQVVFEKQTVNTYVDEIQGNADIEDCGTHDAPTLEDEDVPGALETRCAQLHYHFMGWVTAANKANPTDDNIITPGTSMTADGATYYAVWARGNGGSLTVTQANCAAGASASGYSNKSWTATGTDGNSYSGIYRIYGNSTSASMQFNNSGIGMYTPQLPGAITSITLVKASGSDRNWTPRVSATTQQTSSSSSNGTNLTAKSVNGTVSWSVDASQNYRYLYLGVAGGASYLSSITVTWGTFSDYICTCCTELASINGSFSLPHT